MPKNNKHRTSPNASSPSTPSRQKRHHSSPRTSPQHQHDLNDNVPFRIYCDLDGVLVDFDKGIRQICNGASPDQLPLKQMWRSVARTRDFYTHLDWKHDGKQLWQALLPLNPDILTGVPMHYESRLQKYHWCRRELHGATVNHVDMAGNKMRHSFVGGNRRRRNVTNVITCWSRNKHMESGYKRVLIDDRASLADEWTRRGGIFVHHTSTERTLQILAEHGILSAKEDDGGGEEEEEEKKKKKELQANELVMKDGEETAANEEPLYDMPPDTP